MVNFDTSELSEDQKYLLKPHINPAVTQAFWFLLVLQIVGLAMVYFRIIPPDSDNVQEGITQLLSTIVPVVVASVAIASRVIFKMIIRYAVRVHLTHLSAKAKGFPLHIRLEMLGRKYQNLLKIRLFLIESASLFAVFSFWFTQDKSFAFIAAFSILIYFTTKPTAEKWSADLGL